MIESLIILIEVLVSNSSYEMTNVLHIILYIALIFFSPLLSSSVGEDCLATSESPQYGTESNYCH